MLEARRKRIRETTAHRQLDLAVVMDNVHDPHNISAVLRSCDSVGVCDVYVLYDHPRLRGQELELGKRSSSGARKWIRVHLFRDASECFNTVKNRYANVLASEVNERSSDLYALDLTLPTALIFGNEHEGISDAARAAATGSFCIPQMGMVKSLNISVACAVSLYEAYRQRKVNGSYKQEIDTFQGDRKALYELYLERHEQKISGKRYVGFDPDGPKD